MNATGVRALMLTLAFFPGQLLAQARPRDAAPEIPVRLEVKPDTSVVEAGSKCTVTVTLKGFRGQRVAAPENVAVALSLGAMGNSTTVTVPKGESSATAELTPSRSGIAEIEASSPKLLPASAALLVRPRKKARPVQSPPVTISELSGATRASRSPASVPETATSGEPARRGSFSSTVAAQSGVTTGTATVETAETITQDHSAPPSQPDGGVGLSHPAPSGEKANAGTTEAGPVGTPVQPSAPASAPEVSPPLPEKSIGVSVNPNPVSPMAGTWKSEVTLAVLSDNQALTEAKRDMHVLLSANVGSISPKDVLIRAGQYSASEQAIQLTSQRPGADVVRAQSRLGTTTAEVVYSKPEPSRLSLEAVPLEVANDGRSPIRITVLLRDKDNHVAEADGEVEVALTSTPVGEVRPSKTKIQKGSFLAEVQLTSARPGEARVKAEAPGLSATEVTVRFLFPWGMVVCAALGGVLGGGIARFFAHKTGSQASAQKHFWLILGVALTCGVVFWGLVFFGAATGLVRIGIDIDVSKIPTYNAAGSGLLGALGSFLALAPWKGIRARFKSG